MLRVSSSNMAQTTRTRLSPEIFDLPVEKMRAGWYTDAYFNHARDTLLKDERRPRVVLQIFQKEDAWLGGMDEAIAILKLCANEYEALEVHALFDGDRIEPYEPVMHIEGDYTAFAHLETPVLGTLARRTLITTNVVHVLEAANGKQIIFMPARHDHHRIQTGDGYAAYVAGQITGAEIGVTTNEQASWWGGRESLVDRSLWGELGDFQPTGVNERLVWKVRSALDEHGYDRLRIVVSGGFNVEKISYFEDKGVPVDAYGVGSSLIRGSNDFTADIVLTDGKPSAKVGRRYRESPRLELVA